MKISFDTNAYTHFLAGDEHVLAAIVEAEVTYLSTIVLGELFAGFKGGHKFKENIAILKSFLSKPSVAVADITSDTAYLYGETKDSLQTNGTPIPTNDVWIAAHAFEKKALLVTYDKHFLAISGLPVWDRLQ